MSPLNRRSFVTSLGAASLSGIAAASEFIPQPTPTPTKNFANRRPNVILMICDDLGYGDLGCYGSKLNTPNLDRMAAEGARFLHYNGGHPICSASRGSLMTGRYSTRTGVRPVYSPKDPDGLSQSETTIANLLRDQKYRTACLGKWHLGDKPGTLPTDHGFDSFFGVPYSVDMRPVSMYQNEEVIEEHTDASMLTPRYTDSAVKFIEHTSPEPFFLYLAYNYPHIPVDASPRFKGKSKQGIYGDAVEEIDWSVGEIMAALKRKGIDDNTLLLFTADHGPWYLGYPGPSRGRKGTTYEGGFRVPFLAQWKGTIPAGHVSPEWATHLDILPTIANICGAKLPTNPLDGLDISSALAGGAAPARTNPTLYFSGLHGGFDLQCARLDGWKVRFAQYTRETYVLGGDPGESLMLQKPELYNINDDPGESYDIADQHPDLVNKIIQQVDAMMAKFPDRALQAYSKLKQNIEGRQGPVAAAARPLKEDHEVPPLK